MEPKFHSGRRLALARKLFGLTQENLISEPDFPMINVKTLRRWETSGVTLSRLEDIAYYFKAPIWLFTEESLDRNLFQRLITDPAQASQHSLITKQLEKVRTESWFSEACDLMLSGQLTAFAELVQKKSINQPGAEGWTLLMWAAHWGYIDFLSWMVQHGAEVEVADQEGFSPLICAAARGQNACLTYLVHHTNRINHADNQGWTALTWAASHKNLDCLAVLLRAGANPNPQNQQGELPLFRAIRSHHFEVVRLLLGRLPTNPVVNQPDQQGERALHLAIGLRVAPMVQLLLDHGANPKLTNHLGILPYDLACSLPDQRIKSMLKSGF